MSDIETMVYIIDDLQSVRNKVSCLDDKTLTLDLWKRLDKLLRHAYEIKAELVDREIDG